MQNKVIVIGAGFSGLSAAALLGKKGYDVTLLEKNHSPGGRAMIYKDKGFTFDMGPSWYLMPEVFERFFSFFNKKTSDYYSLKRLDPGYRLIFNKNDYIDIHKSLSKNKKTFDRLETDGAKKLEKYLEKSSYQYETAMNKFVYKEYNSLMDFYDKQLLLEGAKLHLFENMDKYVKRFFKEDKIQKILQYNLVFLGGAPKNTPAIYALMAHIDFNQGVWYPENGGMANVVKALVKLCQENNVKIKYEEDVENFEIDHESKKIKNVFTKKNKYTSDIVLSSADYHFTETKLLTKNYQTYNENYWSKKTMAPSAFIMYIGLSKKIKGISHHNLFIENNWINHFNEIFDNPTWPDKPSYYICCPSKTDDTVAPKNFENLFFLVPVASGLQDNANIRSMYTKKIISHFEKTVGEKISDSIVTLKTLSLNDYKSLYNSYKGSALGLSHTLLQTALFRPSHKSKKISNLYYTGQYTHPGIGVPMALISSQLSVEKIADDYD